MIPKGSSAALTARIAASRAGSAQRSRSATFSRPTPCSAEIEPFKTAIILKFSRAWPFVTFALGLLFIGLFIERFYCRYLCPLGAGLAIPAKLKVFDWLRRRPQCGRECRLCETKCTVGAIDPLGRINPNECVLCLRCQVVMNDAQTCPVLKRRARTPDAPKEAT